MEENEIKSVDLEPSSNDENSKADTPQNEAQADSKAVEDKSQDPSALILGKFKSADDLAQAYKQLEKLQGNQSSELGMLREKVASMNSNSEALKLLETVLASKDIIRESAKKYPEYFADPSFKQLYTEAFRILGADLDVDKLVNLIEGYASARIFAHEKSKSAKAETQSVLGEMKFDKNDQTVKTPVKKSIQQMTPKELDEMLERLI